MAELPTVQSSVALIERVGPNPRFFLEHRRSQGDFPHAGKTGFFGGCAEPGEDAWATIFREVGDEELRLRAPTGSSLEWQMIGTEELLGHGSRGVQVLRSVTLFHLLLPKGTMVRVRPNEQARSELVAVPTTEENISALSGVLTPYAHTKLLERIRGVGPWKGIVEHVQSNRS